MQNDAVDVSLKKKLILRSPEVTQSQKCSKRGQKKLKFWLFLKLRKLWVKLTLLELVWKNKFEGDYRLLKVENSAIFTEGLKFCKFGYMR